MADYKEKSFDFAYEIVKQIISISTILLGVSVTFFEKFNYLNNNWALITSWILFLVCILIGLFVMMGITGSLSKNSNPSIYDANNTGFTIILVILFIAAFGFLVFHTTKIMNYKPVEEKKEKVIYVIVDKKNESCCKKEVVNGPEKDTLKLSVSTDVKK
ncbi:hypothetical protein [Flavobacterium nackdongense]|jgi:archaellum component FlaF (FlaF/FlaG flagellin family)|uniref:Uncharacterized protein n=1 Tax=Flavobacterium nackdongense TaxID=2547394 RepID=A0A4P6Y9F0_9FLAO|nr:hypothetical protein [Flavobacterium nackdongense]QBN17264.1 hypothetical protein E1750_00065 [Flavobacterium nackdongense]